MTQKEHPSLCWGTQGKLRPKYKLSGPRRQGEGEDAPGSGLSSAKTQNEARAERIAVVLKVESRPAAAASAGSLIEMQILRPRPRLIKMHALGGGSKQSVL